MGVFGSVADFSVADPFACENNLPAWEPALPAVQGFADSPSRLLNLPWRGAGGSGVWFASRES